MSSRRRRRSRRSGLTGAETGVTQEKANGSLVEKLGLRGGRVLCLVNPPQGFYARLSNELPVGSHLYLGLPPRGTAHVFLLWPDGTSNLESALSYLKTVLDPEGTIWVVIPRRKGVRVGAPEVSLQAVQEAARKVGLVDKERLSISGSQYGVQLVLRKGG